MPAHRAEPAQAYTAVVPAVGLLLALLMIATVCLLSLGAADSSIEPGDGWASTSAVTVGQ